MDLPNNIFGCKIQASASPIAAQLPRAHARAFEFLEASVPEMGGLRFHVFGSSKRADTKVVVSAAKALRAIDGGDCAYCSPMLDYWQKRALAQQGVPFIQDEGNMFLPFAGVSARGAGSARTPRKVSPQAQRLLGNVIGGQWSGINAKEASAALGKSKASVSKYYAELEAVCPTLVKRAGREKSLACDRSAAASVLGEFEPYLSSPVVKRIEIAMPEILDEFKEAGCRVSGESALALKSDLAFDGERITLAMPKPVFDRWAPGAEAASTRPRYGAASLVVEQWSYWDDFPDSQAKGPAGMECVSDFSLFASFAPYSGDDIRLSDAIEQVKERICR